MNRKLLLGIACIAFLFASSDSKAQQYPGYILYSVQRSSTTYLIDTAGTTYHTWNHNSSDQTGYSIYLMPGGILWRSLTNSNSLNGGGMTGRVQKVDWNGTVLWDFTYSSSTYCLHHDFCPLPNGNVLLISYDVISSTDVAAAGCTYNGSVWSEKIMEVQPTGATTGNVVWEWRLWDHILQNVDANKPNYQSSIVNHPELMNVNFSISKDWFHMNGIDYNPVLDQIALSSHNQDMWFIIDHSTTTSEAASHSGGNAGKGGDFLYRYGNPSSYGASGSTALDVTHDAHWIPEFVPNAGRLVGFNNRGVSSSKSSVDQIDVPLNGYNYDITLGSAYSPTTYTERHACNGYSSNMANSVQLPNGNMQVCMATSGLIYEVDPNGTTIWSKTVSGTVPQAQRYSECYVSSSVPTIPQITLNGATLSSTSGTAYQWYLNGQPINGATNQTYTPAENGIYLVRVLDANGCIYSYSTGYNFLVTGLDMPEETVNFNIYPNPTTGLVHIKDAGMTGKRFDLYVMDAAGRTVLQNKNLYQVDMSEYENGVYTIIIRPEHAQPVQQRIVLTR